MKINHVSKICRKKHAGFTLVELLIATGLIAVASMGIYVAAVVATDWRLASTEVKSLSSAIQDIENSSNVGMGFDGISLTNLSSRTNGFKPGLNLVSVSSPVLDRLVFSYSDVNSRVCVNFVEKMLKSSTNISAKVNGNSVNGLSEVGVACNDNVNNVEIALNKSIGSFAVNTITASFNAPPPPAIDVIVPANPIPASFPTIPVFVPPTTTPVTYGITGTAPVYPVVPPSGGPISTTPGGGGGGNVSQPGWTPPGYTAAPPATSAGVDEIDQDVLPPIVTKERQSVSCPSGYTGNIIQVRTKTLYQTSGRVVYSSWTEESNSCVAIPLVYTKTFPVCQSGYMWEHDANSANHCWQPTNVRGSITLTFASVNDVANGIGRVNVNYGGLQSCNWGESSDGVYYDPSISLPVMSNTPSSGSFNWRARQYSIGNMDLAGFNAMRGYVFSCLQTG